MAEARTAADRTMAVVHIDMLVGDNATVCTVAFVAPYFC
jgi:hypothetical protein